MALPRLSASAARCFCSSGYLTESLSTDAPQNPSSSCHRASHGFSRVIPASHGDVWLGRAQMVGSFQPPQGYRTRGRKRLCDAWMRYGMINRILVGTVWMRPLLVSYLNSSIVFNTILPGICDLETKIDVGCSKWKEQEKTGLGYRFWSLSVGVMSRGLYSKPENLTEMDHRPSFSSACELRSNQLEPEGNQSRGTTTYIIQAN